jgi:hypothetical protein
MRTGITMNKPTVWPTRRRISAAVALLAIVQAPALAQERRIAFEPSFTQIAEGKWTGKRL